MPAATRYGWSGTSPDPQLLLVHEGGDARERFAFQVFERRAAAGGDVGELVVQAGLVDKRDGLAAADDGRRVLELGEGFGHGERALGEGGILGDADAGRSR